MQNRLDLATTLGRVADAQRQTVVAADALNAVFDLVASADAGGRRSSLAGGTDDADLRFDEGVYSAGVNLTLPFERTAERNQYRQSLIALDRSIRAAQQAEDQVKLQVIAALRDLRVAAEDARIQFTSILTARRRVAAANLRQELGQGQIRDITEAEEDLVDAENGYTQALVDFRIAELQLQRDLGPATGGRDGPVRGRAAAVRAGPVTPAGPCRSPVARASSLFWFWNQSRTGWKPWPRGIGQSR